MSPLVRAGSILILIVFIIESILIIPLIWTIPAFNSISKISKGIATDNDKMLVAILGIIFGAFLGVVGGILILVDFSTKK
ncbi:MAG: hypothetical protein REH79_00990 [Spiroplasma sp.]|nr:hypothetical protein [Spiroplasma sp.]